MTIDFEAISSKLDQILARTSAQASKHWLTLADIAEQIGLAEQTVNTKVVNRSTFPEPTYPSGSRKHRIWPAEEVHQWLKVNRGHLPQGRKRAA